MGVFCLAWMPSAQAQDYNADVNLVDGSIRTNNNVIAGETVRVYATVKNDSSQDLVGTVKFYDETSGAFIGEDQPFSAIGGGTDDVFVDWLPTEIGNKTLTARVIPWEDNGDNPNNNKATTTIYVDQDSDGDGTPDQQDVDDDNDGVNDDEDVFPFDSQESADADGDGIGDNADEDDDNDGVLDVEDVFTTDPTESKDSDGDGVGDNSDAFPDDSTESEDKDGDGLGANRDPNDNNQGPKIVLNDFVSEGVIAGKSILLDASSSTDPDGEIKSYEWDFGNGYEKGEAQMKHTYPEAGDYILKLRVTDEKGEYRTFQADFEVKRGFNLLWIVLILGLIILSFVGARLIKKKSKISEKQ